MKHKHAISHTHYTSEIPQHTQFPNPQNNKYKFACAHTADVKGVSLLIQWLPNTSSRLSTC